MTTRADRDTPDYPHPSSPAATVRMKANRGRNTTPELRLRSVLYAADLRYRIHLPVRVDSSRPISVDIAFPSRKVAVFVDGCFWHGCQEHRTVPIANGSYWGPKLARNAERDREVVARLQMAGWTALRFWEHDDPEAVTKLVVDLVGKRQSPSDPR